MDSEAAKTDDLLVSRREGVVTATFNRPHARNALTFAMYDALAALCGEIDADPSVAALILTGAGLEAFAAGTDIAQFRAFATDLDALAYEARIEHVLRKLEHCRVPTIAAMAGACTGGGAAIAGCCDLRIGATNLKFGFPIARTLGNSLSVENLARLVALIGEARVKDMIFTARLYDAEEARGMGLVSAAVAVADLATRADDLARTVIANAPLTLRSTKLALARLRPQVTPADDLVLMCYRSLDFREGVAAFGAKRSPRWEGR
jgi:enoyl-CoA hydratase/carnithine racemase